MDVKIEDIKPGARIYLGKYAAKNSGTPEEISWLKADYGTKIISEKVLDYIQFDAPERARSREHRAFYYGYEVYELSNIYQYLNGCEMQWFSPSHPMDATPSYAGRPGFLYYFDDYEINSIQNIDLPSLSNIIENDSPDFMPLFKKHGIRPHPTERVVALTDMGETSFSDFWVKDVSIQNTISVIGRDGQKHTRYPTYECGLRPVISLLPGTKIQIDENGIFTVSEFIIPESDICTENELFSFLGLR